MPERRSTAGDEVADFADACGMTLDDEQRLVLDAMFSEDVVGLWAALEFLLICARQNLKTHVFKAAALAHLFLFDARLVTWTAHLFVTTQEAFRDLDATIENHDHLRRRVKQIHRGNGEECIELYGDRRCMFKARTKTGGRGLTGDLLILDEAFALSGTEMGSVMPALSARPNPQILYGSSAGHASSALLRTLRDRGRSMNDSELAYVEWCAEKRPCQMGDKCDHRYGSVGCALDDEALWEQANPALDRRVTRRFLRTERKALPPIEFARETLTWWEEPDESEDGLDVEAWNACADPNWIDASDKARALRGVVFAVTVAHDLSWSSITTSGWRTDGKLLVEVVEYRPGTGWVAERAHELVATYKGSRLYMLEKGPRSSIGDDLEDLGVEWESVTPTQLVDACGAFEDRMKRGVLRHIAQPELDVAVGGGRRRPSGDGWTWAQRASIIEISPLVGVTVAAYGACTRPDADDGEPQIY